MTLRLGRSVTRFSTIFHGWIGGLIVLLPLMRVSWDQWAQSTVHLSLSFLFILGAVLVLLGRSVNLVPWRETLRRFGFFWAVFLVSSGVSAFFSQHPHSAFPAVLNDFALAAFWGIAACISSRWCDRYVRAFSVAGVLSVVFAFFLSESPSVSWTGPLLNPNLLAALILLTGPAVLERVLVSESSRFGRLFWVSGAGVLVLGLALSRSLVGLATVALQAGFFFFFLRGRRFPSPAFVKSSGLTRSFVFMGGAAFLLWGGALWWARDEWGKIVHGDADRWGWAITALRIFSAHPVWGVGPGSFGEAYPLFRFDPWGLNSSYAHNFVLEVLAERGGVGGGVFLFLVGSLLFEAWCSVRRGKRPGLFLGLMGFCVYNFFHIGFSFPGLVWLFFVGAGLAMDRPVAAAHEIGRGRGWVLGAGAAWLLVGVVSFGLFRSDQFLARARVLLSQGQWSLARNGAESGLRWNPWNFGLYEIRAGLRAREGDWAGAARDMDRSVHLAPTSAGLRVERAELAVRRGDRAQALGDYQTAIDLLPLKTSSWERRGDLLREGGRLLEARRSYLGARRALESPLSSLTEEEKNRFRARLKEKQDETH